MLVFIDESGDTGRRTEAGSSNFFVMGLVLFQDMDEATDCDKRITLLKKELHYPDTFEFHFKQNSHRVKEAFLKATMPYNFTYYAIAINKDPDKLWGNGFNNKESFYKYACNMVFTHAMPYLDNAIVVLDKSGNPTFRKNLARYLKQRINHESRKIKKLKQQTSHSNNLIQFADYVAGVINRKVQQKKDWEVFYKYIRAKEIRVQEWTK